MASQLGEFFPFIPGKESDAPRSVFDLIDQRRFDKLRSIARRLLASERFWHTLQATALVHEAFIKLIRWPCRIDSEAHLYRLTARAMKETLIDHGRVRNKRIHVSPEDLPGYLLAIKRPEIDPELALTINIVLERLRDMDAAAADAVWAFYVEEKTLEETCRDFRKKPTRVRGDIAFGLKWIADHLGKSS